MSEIIFATLIFWTSIGLGILGIYHITRSVWHFFCSALDALSIIDTDKDFRP